MMAEIAVFSSTFCPSKPPGISSTIKDYLPSRCLTTIGRQGDDQETEHYAQCMSHPSSASACLQNLISVPACILITRYWWAILHIFNLLLAQGFLGALAIRHACARKGCELG